MTPSKFPQALLFLLVVLCAVGGYRYFQPSHLSAVWLLAALLLEITAVRYPGRGIYTGAVALYLSGACFDDFGAIGVVTSLALGLAARALGPGSTGTVRYDAILHGIPCLTAALIPVFWQAFLNLEPYLIAFAMMLVVYYLVDEYINQKYVFTSLKGETRISWMRLRRSVLDIRAGIAVAALILLTVTNSFPWLPMAFVPILWMTHRGMRNAIFRVQAMLAAELEKQTVRLSRDLETTKGELVHTEQARANLQHEVGQLSVVLRSARVLGSELQVDRLLALAQQLATEEFKVDSGVLLWNTSDLAWGPTTRETLQAKKAPNTFYCRLPKEGKDFGHLYFQWQKPPQKDAEFEQLLETFAFSLGLALENASRYKQVVEVQKQLVESSKLRAIGQLAAGVAHELNSPLGAVRLALEALATQDLGERGQKRVKSAHGACHRALTIVDKLLIYSREKKRAPRPFPLAEAIGDTLVFLRADLQTESIEIQTKLDEETKVMGVSGEIQQILINLILNAVQACREVDESRRTITLSTKNLGDIVEIDVADLGPGVAAEYRDRIFEPFFTTKEVGQGTGLGLSISQEIAAAHNGTLELVSGIGETGARFRLRLPRSAS